MRSCERYAYGPAFQGRTMGQVLDQIERMKRGGIVSETRELFTVPAGFALRCSTCKRELGPGARVEVNDVTGKITCLRCVSRRQNAQKPVGPAEKKHARAKSRRE